jgi:gamma-glutamyltranspeptidase/glutathione hydrolase
MSPTLVIAPDGLPLLTAGSPGSARIFSTVLQIVINVIDHGMNIQEAIEAPRIYAPVDEIAMEARIDLATRKALEEMGHRLDVRGEWDVFFGGAHGIQRDRKTGYLIGGADPRRSGRAIGY